MAWLLLLQPLKSSKTVKSVAACKAFAAMLPRNFSPAVSQNSTWCLAEAFHAALLWNCVAPPLPVERDWRFLFWHRQRRGRKRARLWMCRIRWTQYRSLPQALTCRDCSGFVAEKHQAKSLPRNLLSLILRKKKNTRRKFYSKRAEKKSKGSSGHIRETRFGVSRKRFHLYCA